MGFKIGIDIGGTFTDFVVIDEKGDMYTTKTASTPGKEATGVMTGLEKIAKHYHMDFRDFLANTELIVHGSTVATNTMVQHNGAKTGLLTTKGFRDEIEIRRGIKESQYDPRLEPPFPIVPRRRRLGVRERVDYKGTEVIPLDEDDARQAIGKMKTQGVEAIAVSYLFSFANPKHELRTLELLKEEYPDAYASISSNVIPQIRDFERTSTTVVNAYVGPTLKNYLKELEKEVRDQGYKGALYIMQSNGGLATIDYASEKPVYCLASGPCGGVTAAIYLSQLIGYEDVISVDMGGTSYDSCLIKKRQASITTDHWVARYRVMVPMIDAHVIGAGGGSIAWIDSGGALKVGPKSAGADPGPACYAKGGDEPTVTDADLILGYLDADSFAAGEIKLDRKLAEKAIGRRVAKALGMSVVEAAWAIFRIVNNNMANGIRAVSTERGYDPRDFTLMAFGGAGPVHAGVQARDLRMERIIVPKPSSMFCAFGDLVADVRINQLRTFIGELDSLDLDKMSELIGELAEGGKTQLPEKGLLGTTVEMYADLRYSGEVHEITVPVRGEPRRLTQQDMLVLTEDFHRLHEQLYGYREDVNKVEIVNLRVDAVGRTWTPQVKESAYGGEDASHAIKSSRSVFFGDGYRETPVYNGELIQYGNIMPGPCIIEEPWLTIVVQPRQKATRDKYSNYVIEAEPPTTETKRVEEKQ